VGSGTRATPPETVIEDPDIDEDWTAELIRSSKGKRAPVVQNALIAIRKAPEWRGVLGLDESALRIMILKPPPWEEQRKLPFQWSDEDDVRTAGWLQTNRILATPLTARQAIATVASEHRYHPIRDYLNGLVWDGDGRAHNWLATYLGVKPNEYVSAVGCRWLIAAVARIYEPGCKNDCCLILEGKQGAGKSTALRTLAEPWFTDDMPELGTKDSQLQTRGVWIIELSELDSMTRGEVSRVKAYMSRLTDRFRPPYGRAPIDVPRECVFAGTSNKGAYLRDETGGRRFWPVQCGAIDIPWLKQDRDQLFAEAVALYRDGSPWWLNTEKLTHAALEEQEDRYDSDPWDELIAPWVRGRVSVSVGEVLDACINKPAAQWSQQDLNRVARSLVAMRWERFKAGPRGDREWRYRPRLAD
jgi:predicted P-loop ATPase